MTTGQTDLKDTFSCAARVGVSGDERVAEAMVAAISPAMNAPGGCNEGFLRRRELSVDVERTREQLA